ncbi:MAG: fibronectin type III domain-containing protein [Bacteroidota bacterium]
MAFFNNNRLNHYSGLFFPGFLLLVLINCSSDDDATTIQEQEDPQEPIIESPVLNAPRSLINEVTISWNDYDGATGFEVDVSTDTGFSEILSTYDSSRVSGLTTQLVDLAAGTEHYIRIRAVLSKGVLSPNSNIQMIRTLEDKACGNPAEYVFVESGGIVKAEFEDAFFENKWALISNDASTSGSGYMRWDGADYFGSPSTDLTTFKISISTTGTYRFIWRSAYTVGNNGTEHNDTWLRFPDADDFFAQQEGGGKVFPRGVGKTPNPEGASTDGWFKIYRSGDDKGFKWQSNTYDNNAHPVFITFDEPDTYTMEVSARSNGHGIDQFALFHKDNVSETQATSADFSEIVCSTD